MGVQHYAAWQGAVELLLVAADGTAADAGAATHQLELALFLQGKLRLDRAR